MKVSRKKGDEPEKNEEPMQAIRFGGQAADEKAPEAEAPAPDAQPAAADPRGVEIKPGHFVLRH